MPKLTVIGVMSGSSLDGLDIAAVKFNYKKEQLESWTVKAAQTVAFPDELLETLTHVRELSGYQLSLLDVRLGTWIGQQVNAFIEQQELKPDLISSHGHTVFHEPSNHLSLQIGHGAAIKAVTELPVVNQFRSENVALGGQGAPLVPVGDRDLFTGYDAWVNLGGIANVSYGVGPVWEAFDVVPCNQLLNHLAQREGQTFDMEGQMARKGKLIPTLLDHFLSWPYFHKLAPKSLGNAEVMTDFTHFIGQWWYTEPTEDLLHTICEGIAIKLGEDIPSNKKRVLFTGGGALNRYLMERIFDRGHFTVVVPDLQTVQYKEAIIFAYLGYLHHLGLPNTTLAMGVPPHVAGCVY